MQTLPKCTTLASKPIFIEKTHFTNKKEFLEQLKELIGSDCWAFLIDDEIIWNDYTNSLNHKQRIYESMTRDYLIKNTHLVLQNDNQKHTLQIYMHSTRILLIKILLETDNYSMTFFN